MPERRKVKPEDYIFQVLDLSDPANRPELIDCPLDGGRQPVARGDNHVELGTAEDFAKLAGQYAAIANMMKFGRVNDQNPEQSIDQGL